LALVHDCSLLLCWSWEEAARYLETFKVYEKKPPTSIQVRNTQHSYKIK
jgi:DNA excision repair protein ERCC-1